jgi:NAD+ kinase
MKYYVVTRNDSQSEAITNRFHELAQSLGMIKDQATPDLVLTIGGDGTLLQAFHEYANRLDTTGFVGVHTGHLGFYADWDPQQIEELAQLIAHENLEEKVVKYPLVEIELETASERHHYYALNECTLKGIHHTMVAEIHLNDELFVQFRGDGICISTPSGSTAYNKSLGGAIIHPSFDGIQIAEIASINNRVYRSLGSSILLPDHHHCDILPRQNQNLLLTIDHLSRTHHDIQSLRCRVAKQKIRFVRYRPFTFWNRVH